MARPRKEQTENPVAVVEQPKSRKPHIEVLERRLQSPFGMPSRAIQLKEPGWTVRVFNRGIKGDKIWEAEQNGWQKVKREELADPEQMGGFDVSPEGYVVRGERGQELLMKMLTDWYNQIQRAKADVNIRNMKRPGAVKNEVVAAAGQRFGGQAADYIDRHVQIVGDVVDKKERIQSVEEP